MKKVEDFINCIFEKEEGWAYSYGYSKYSLEYIKDSVTVTIYPYLKTVEYNNFLGKYLGLGEEEVFYSCSIKKEGKGSLDFYPEHPFEFKTKVYDKIKDIKLKRAINILRKNKELINSLEC